MNIEIEVEHEDCSKPLVAEWIKESLAAAFRELKICRDDLEICFLITNDEEVRNLNKTYRGIDKPTNILSFPSGMLLSDLIGDAECECDACAGDEFEEDELSFLDDLGEDYPNIIGSIAISYDTVLRESAEQEISLQDHMCHLVVHGILHLVGYDHETDKEAQEMESLEVKILNNLGIKNPYE